MNITYFHRNPSAGYSIGKVSRTYISEIEKTEQVENLYMPCANASLWSMLKNICFAYKYSKKRMISHFTGDVQYAVLGSSSTKTVWTIHDLVFLERSKGLKRIILLWLFLYLPVNKSSKIVCISEKTKRDVLKYIHCSKKIFVIPNAVDPIFKFAKFKFNTLYPHILCIGTGINKNLYRTIEALHGIPCHLRIVGVVDDELLFHLNLYHIDYSTVHHLSDMEIFQEYVNCDMVSFVSWYEGFGMPVIEAQAVGRPVLTSDISPMKEISGKAAVLVDPYNIKSIRKGFLSIIEDGNLRERLITEGLKNAEFYSSTYVANEYLKIYRSLL